MRRLLAVGAFLGVLGGGAAAFAFVDPTIPVRIALLVKIADSLREAYQTLREVNDTVWKVRDRLDGMFPWDALREIESDFRQIRTLQQQITDLSCDWRFSLRMQALKDGLWGGGPLCRREYQAVFGAPVLEAYGMTEASHQMASNPLPPGERRAGTVGIATGIEIGIMDEAGALLASGDAGEVVIKGPSIIDAYANNPEANAKAFTTGWFRTGDQGVLGAGGYLSLIGRLKEMINRGGEKIGPREIDEVLLSHPAVAEAVCFGIPHPSWGEEVAAAVVLKDAANEAEILAFCKERLAEFKRPKRIYITKAIPRTATGKIQRGVVAKAFAEA